MVRTGRVSAWILLRGWTRESRHWSMFPAQLRAALPEAEPIALDLPGSGELRDHRSPASIAPMVAHCRETLRARGIAAPYGLLGLSLGAMACVEWAARHPAEIRGAVLINTSLRPFSAFHERLRPESYATILRLALFERDVRAREAAILRLTSAGGGAEVLDAWTRIGRERPVSRANVLRQLMAAASYRAPRTPPQVPLLVLASAHDRLVDPECSRRLAQCWGTAFAQHPRAGHDLPLDDGAWVAARVAEWIRRS